MVEQTTSYGMSTTIPVTYDDALERVRAALGKEGFGVLTEIDVRATLKKKLDIDVQPYAILGACNPSFAYQALSAEPDIGLLLPCNVVVRAGKAPGENIVSAMDPVAALELAENDAVRPVAVKVRAALERALADLG